ncbi:hypothetical protein [Sphingopyxis sp. H107]|uniref:hypothetical protein n=1 Tax=Sphingopyxis sp. H107 TaxID=1759082 RepID=UPI0012E32F02|nr:hypothetical protein [Sphingopyxis sp. H107]
MKKNKQWTPERRAEQARIIGDRNRGVPKSDITKERMRQAKLGKPQSPKHVRKRIAAMVKTKLKGRLGA